MMNTSFEKRIQICFRLLLVLALCLTVTACSRNEATVEQSGQFMEIIGTPDEQHMMYNPTTEPPTEEPTIATLGTNCIGLTEKDLPEDAKVMYLTFDDGPSSNTPKILDILDRYGCGATFFVMKSDYEDQYKNIVDHGHSIALHTYSHDFEDVYESTDNYFADLERISNVVFDKTGVRSKLIRFPGGSSNTRSRSICEGIMTELVDEVEERGYAYFDWNADSEDASGNNIPSSRIVNASTSFSQRKIVLLLHDTDLKDTTVEALPQIIEHFIEQGYYFLSLNENSPTAHHAVLN